MEDGKISPCPSLVFLGGGWLQADAFHIHLDHRVGHTKQVCTPGFSGTSSPDPTKMNVKQWAYGCKQKKLCYSTNMMAVVGSSELPFWEEKQHNKKM